MKVLHIITSLKIGGAERALCTLLAGLSKNKNDQHHVAYFYDGPCRETLQSLNIPTYPIKGLISRYDFFAYHQLKQLVQKIKPNVIHTSLWSANIMGRIIGLKSNIPVISDLHGNCIQEGFLRNLLDQWTAHIPFRTVAVAQQVKDAYQKHVINGISSSASKHQATKRLVVIKNGIDRKEILTQSQVQACTRKDLALEPNTFVVGSIGRLEPIKSYDLLIKAFAHFLLSAKTSVTSKLLLVGDGSQMKFLKETAIDLGIQDEVIFLGAQTNPYRFYPVFDCFVLSSQSEGLSIALLEALVFGLPIITTHKDKTHEVITNWTNGIIVPPNDIYKLSHAMTVLSQKPELVDAIKQANQKLIQNNFDSNVTNAAYQALFYQSSNYMSEIN